MPAIPWNEKYNVHVDQIDQQHQKLIDILNEFYETLRTKQSKDATAKILSQLLDYTKYHFTMEENLTRSYGYPGYLHHKKLHDDFVQKVADAIARLQQGKLVLPIEVGNLARDWLISHIMVVDKELGAFLNNNGLR